MRISYNVLLLTAFHIAQYLESESDVYCLELPRNLKKIVKQFLVTYSTDYIGNQHLTEIKTL